MTHKVLFVDDEPKLLHGLCRALRHQPYKILTAHSAEEAMAIFKAHAIDLVVSDENMPGLSGTQLLAWVAEHFPSVVRIVLTGEPSIAIALRAINDAGVYRFFTKPFDVVELGLTISQALEEKNATQFSEVARR